MTGPPTVGCCDTTCFRDLGTIGYFPFEDTYDGWRQYMTCWLPPDNDGNGASYITEYYMNEY